MTKKINTRGLFAFNTKDNHCYQISSNNVGTRNRVTMIDIYGHAHRKSITHLVPMTPYEAAVVSTGERLVRRKAASTESERQLMSLYRDFIASHK